MDLTIRHTNSDAQAQQLTDEGFCPVECSIGGKSVVDDLEMDHHGELSHLEGVAVRAYRDHFGARRDDPRFVVTGAGDADACFAIAALVGLLPHPSRADEFATAPPHIKKPYIRDISVLAALVNQVDTEPIGVRLETTEEGRALLFWNELTSLPQVGWAFQTGIGLWVRLTTGRPLTPHYEVSGQGVAERRAAAEQDLENSETVSDKVLLVLDSKAWGFDVWYETAPVVIAHVESNRNITVGCKDTPTAEALFGDGGLKNAFEALGEVTDAPGWGGREAIGGSPRGMEMSPDQARAAARCLAELIRV